MNGLFRNSFRSQVKGLTEKSQSIVSTFTKVASDLTLQNDRISQKRSEIQEEVASLTLLDNTLEGVSLRNEKIISKIEKFLED
jgi:hypothetical protein